MEFKPSHREDIHRYYRSTFVKFKEMGDTLFYIQEVLPDRITGIVEDNEPFVLYMSEEHPYVIDYVLPHKSFFQYQGQACMLQRIPAKQYSRGLSIHNTEVAYYDGDRVRKLTMGFEVLKAFVQKQKFFTLAEAIASDNVSCVLSPRMMYRKKTIFVDFLPVAYVNLKEQKIEMVRKVFTNEVTDFLKESGETMFKVIA